jgi:hypothetical protein
VCSGTANGVAPPALSAQVREILVRYGAVPLATRAPDPNLCSRCGGPATGGALTADSKRFCGMCAGIHLQETAAAQAALARQAPRTPALPAASQHLPPVRPARPANGDVSVVLEYLHQLERYADQLEQVLATLQGERGPIPTLKDIESGPLVEIASEVASIKAWIAEMGADATPAWIATHQNELRSWRKRLDSLADDETIDTEAYDALSARIGDTQARLVELHEVAA